MITDYWKTFDTRFPYRYILLQLSGVAGGFLQIVPLIVYYVKLFLLGSTPRSVYAIKNTMRSVQWGTLFPNISKSRLDYPEVTLTSLPPLPLFGFTQL